MRIDEIEKLDRNFLTASEAAAAIGISLATFSEQEQNGIPDYPNRQADTYSQRAVFEFSSLR